MNRHLQALWTAHPSLPPEATVPIMTSAWRKPTTLKKIKKKKKSRSTEQLFRRPLMAPPPLAGANSRALRGTPAPEEGGSAPDAEAGGQGARLAGRSAAARGCGRCPGNPRTRLRGRSRWPRGPPALRSGSSPARRPAVAVRLPVGAWISQPRPRRLPLGEGVEDPEVEREGAPWAGGAASVGGGENPRDPRGHPDLRKARGGGGREVLNMMPPLPSLTFNGLWTFSWLSLMPFLQRSFLCLRVAFRTKNQHMHR